MEREWAIADYGNGRFVNHCNRFSHSITHFRHANRKQEIYSTFEPFRSINELCCLLAMCKQGSKVSYSMGQRFPASFAFFILGKGP